MDYFASWSFTAFSTPHYCQKRKYHIDLKSSSIQNKESEKRERDFRQWWANAERNNFRTTSTLGRQSHLQFCLVHKKVKMDKEKGMFILTQRYAWHRFDFSQVILRSLEILRLKSAIDIINRVDASRFPLIVSRIAKKVHLKDDQAFSKAEQKQLEVVLGLSPADVSALLESTAFILEQAAYVEFPNTKKYFFCNLSFSPYTCFYFIRYYVANAATLEQQLTKIGVDAPHVRVIFKKKNLH